MSSKTATAAAPALLGKRNQIVVMELGAPGLWAAYCASRAWRTASVIDACWPASVRTLRCSTPTGSCRSLTAR